MDTRVTFNVTGELAEDCCCGLNKWAAVRPGQQIGVSSVSGKSIGLAICLTSIGRAEGTHVVQFDFARVNVGNHRQSFLESTEELGLTHTVAAYEDGKVG